MASRFLAIICPNANVLLPSIDMATANTGLSTILVAHGIIVLGMLPESLNLPSKAGTIMGRLFSNAEVPEAIGALNAKEAHRLISTKGKSLITDYWGSYVAIIKSDIPEEIFVIRDPSGQEPCYFYRDGDAFVVSSDIETMRASGLYSPELDFDQLPRYLYKRDFRPAATALKGLTELLPGEALIIRGSRHTIQTYWSPWNYVSPRYEGEGEASRGVEQVVQGCVGAWASCYDAIGVGLSGGLDSSVLAACLPSDLHRWTGVTIVSSGPEGDERRYASMVARALEAELVAAFHDLDAVDLTLSSAPNQPGPIGNFLLQSYGNIIRSVTEKQRIGAYFSGVGGDNLFCYMQSATPLLDRIQTEGLGPKAWETVEAICRMTGASYWEVLKMALARFLAGGSRQKSTAEASLLNVDALENNNSGHAWLDRPKGSLPGKAVHILMLLRIQASLGVFPTNCDIQFLWPLYSQPIMEACLSIPTWLWCEGGINRAPVRRAFVDRLPAEIIKRSTKGGPDSFVIECIQAHKPLIRERLMDGHLARRHLINRSQVETVLRSDSPVSPPDHIHLMSLIEGEAWIDHWLSATPKSGNGLTAHASAC